MPELPEVENIRRTLSTDSIVGSELIDIHFARKDLRFPIPIQKLKNLIGQKLLKISRRGKYLLFEFENGVFISHLGMTGQWTLSRNHFELKKHDHLYLTFHSANSKQRTSKLKNQNIYLIYNDPRRFGYIDFISSLAKISEHELFSHLGIEPFDPQMNSTYLKNKAAHSSRAVKTFLMDQSIVVGVGNIYASEVLFQAHVKPQRLAKSIKASEWDHIAHTIKDILNLAISKGGSSIRDYRNSDGSEGSFQKYHSVYGRAKNPCKTCGTLIQTAVIGNRATYWCPKCQK